MENRLNELTGSEWLYWTNTIYETNYPPDRTHYLRKNHGAMKPPELMRDIIKFFTKNGEIILDPFAGVGGTLLGAELAGRKAIGIEINPLWVDLFHKLTIGFRKENGVFVVNSDNENTCEFTSRMIRGDCLEVMKDFADETIAAIITDPPYGCQQQKIKFKNETNFNMKSHQKYDLGNCNSYEEYLTKIKLFGEEALRILKPERYLILMIGDRYYQGEYLPLGVLVAEALREVGFKWKGVRIWWNKATQRPLKPYAVKTCFVPNITHQNILILRKDIRLRKTK